MKDRILGLNRLKSGRYKEISELIRKYSKLMQSKNAREILTDEIGFLESMSKYFEVKEDLIIDSEILKEMDTDSERFGMILSFYPRNTPDGERMTEMTGMIRKIDKSYRNKIKELGF